MDLKKTQLEKIEFRGLPIVAKIIHDIGLRSILDDSFQNHGNQKVSTTNCLLVLIANIILGRFPLYRIPGWAKDVNLRSITEGDDLDLSDDQLGRSLDKLQALDHGSLITKIIRNVITVFNIDLKRMRNDSTTIKAYGRYKNGTSKGIELKHGHSKDHRPDLRQILFSLTLSDDGMIPMHYKCYSGNVTDDKTHIETWNFLKDLSRKADFWYVADCKVCTDEQLTYITDHGGKVITIVPSTWKEVKDFKDNLRNGKSYTKSEIYRRHIPGSWSDDVEYFSVFNKEHSSYKGGHRIYWIYSSEKKKRDRETRDTRLEKAEKMVAELLPKINRGKLKNKESILKKIDEILKQTKTNDLFHVDIRQTSEKEIKKIGKGRPGKNSRYVTETTQLYTMSVTRGQSMIKREKMVDGVFPLLVAGGTISAKSALKAYKDQPNLEKKFTYLKSVHQIAPLYCKSTDRIEAMMLLYFLGLLIQSLAERSLRKAMRKSKIEELPLYPEGRECFAPTASLLMQNFDGLCGHRLIDGETGEVIKRFKDEMNDTQKKVIDLLGLSEKNFWGDEFA